MTVLTQRFEKALVFASTLHRTQERKLSSTPYVSHLLAVCGLVLEHGGTEDETIVALLHDAIEDQAAGFLGGPDALRHKIRKSFGPDVLALVEELTETDEDPKPPWRDRKLKYLEHLKTGSWSARLVAAADQVHNARTTLTDLRSRGAVATWAQFNADRESQRWWYQELVKTFQASGDVPRGLLFALEDVVSEIFPRNKE